jgi:hypothetical protein
VLAHRWAIDLAAIETGVAGRHNAIRFSNECSRTCDHGSMCASSIAIVDTLDRASTTGVNPEARWRGIEIVGRSIIATVPEQRTASMRCASAGASINVQIVGDR